jgi:alpha-amylase
VEKFHLVLLIHGHQPAGNFDLVFEEVYQKSYLPFVEQLERHPAMRLGMHYSGCLLEWIQQRHPDFFDRLRRLVELHQVEMIGGGHYEPILISIPPQDQTEQLRRLNAYLARHFGKAPTGAWLTERVWEPQLPSVPHQPT